MDILDDMGMSKLSAKVNYSFNIKFATHCRTKIVYITKVNKPENYQY